MATELVKRKSDRPYVHGERPVHMHFCPDGEHEWPCNSPYCDEMKMECPEHGGPTPTIQGHEPWRGR
jgi:hypothetical protein